MRKVHLNLNNKYRRIKEFLREHHYPNFRMKQILNAIFKERINKFNEMNVLPNSLREILVKEFGESILEVALLKEQHSEQVTKVLFEISGNEKK